MFPFVQDVRYAVRVLVKDRVVTIFAIASLALSIGASTALFSLMNALMLRSLPVRDPRQLVAISTVRPDGQSRNDALSLRTFEEIARGQRVFSGMFAWNGNIIANFEANGARYPANLNEVSGGAFAILGVQPLLGRLIGPEDVSREAGSPAPVAVLDYRCWQRRYHGDPAVVGNTIRVDGQALTIIGVTPKSFTSLIIDAGSDVTVPLGFHLKNLRAGDPVLLVAGRLNPGVTPEQARAQLQTFWPAVQAANVPVEYSGAQRARFLARRIDVQSAATGNSYLRERMSRPLRVSMGLAGLVLLLACLNLANLMLARATKRRQEMGIRIALGAGRWPLIRQLLTESVVLSMTGAAAGVLVALWTSRLLMNTAWTGYVPHALDTAPDLRVLAFSSAIGLLTGVLFGLTPAWDITGVAPAAALRQNPRTSHENGGTLTKVLVCAQVALSLVLVQGATLFVGSLREMRSADPGFRREGLLAVQLFPQAGREEIPNRTAYYRRLAGRLAELPGVEAVSYSTIGPVNRFEVKQSVSIANSSVAPVQAVRDWVGPDFFSLMGMRLLAGREFEWRDDERAPRVAIVSESLARRLFPEQNPIGRKIDTGREIVGVVSSASLWRAQSYDPIAVYVPLMQEPLYNQPLADIRTTRDASTLAPAVQQTLESMGHHYPLLTQTLEQRADRFLSDERLMANVAAFFGGLALLLAGVGLYGLMSYAVARRTSEIGVRMALGAQSGDVLRAVMLKVTWLVLAGVACGVPAALAVSRLASEMFFGLRPGISIAFSVVILSAVALLAGYLPARRASQIDPITALRCD